MIQLNNNTYWELKLEVHGQLNLVIRFQIVNA